MNNKVLAASLLMLVVVGCSQQNNSQSQILFLNHDKDTNGSVVTLNTMNPGDWSAKELLRFSNTESTIADTPLYVVYDSLSVSPNLEHIAWITYPDKPIPLQHGELSLVNVERHEETHIGTMVTSSTSSGIHWSPDSRFIAYCSFNTFAKIRR
jgi:hypothetical protein